MPSVRHCPEANMTNHLRQASRFKRRASDLRTSKVTTGSKVFNMSRTHRNYKLTESRANRPNLFVVSSESGRWQCVANRRDYRTAKTGRRVKIRLPELGPLRRRDWSRLTGRGPRCEERSRTCDKSGFATVAIRDGAMPTTAQRRLLSRTKGACGARVEESRIIHCEQFGLALQAPLQQVTDASHAFLHYSHIRSELPSVFTSFICQQLFSHIPPPVRPSNVAPTVSNSSSFAANVCDNTASIARSLQTTFETEELSNSAVAHATARASGAHGLQALKRSQDRVIADEEDDGVSPRRLNVAAQSAVGGMLRLLSWSSGLGADKIATPEISTSVARQQRIPGMESQSLQKLKRKRPVDGDLTEETTSPAKRRIERRTHVLVPKQSPFVGSSGASPPPSDPQKAPTPPQKSVATQVTDVRDQMAHAPPPDTTMSSRGTTAQLESLRRTIQSQIGLEILLKHKELRLIDQELAKCQVALEQLRRCSEIPFPASRLSEAVSNGTGPALRTPISGPLPQSPAPWGVADGPYSRHYAKWLLPDSRFDGGFDLEQVSSSILAGKNPAKGRTRGSVPETVGIATKSRSRGGGQLKALSSGYPQPKDKAGLVIQKRKSDGLVIKLVCLDCRRENFSSAQGFINHCRIAHNRSFASHDAAADACGEPVEVDEAGLVVGNETTSASSAGMVHPLIRSAHLLKNKFETAPATSADDADKDSVPSTAVMLSGRPRLGGERVSPPPNYRASPLTPNLSALVKLKGIGLDLEKLVSDVTTPVTMEDSASDESGDEGAVTPEAAPFRGRHPQIAGTKQPVRSTVSPLPMDRSSGMKGAKRDPKPRSLEILATPSNSAPIPPKNLISTSYDLQEFNSLEPSPTNESNQAPSLVDDDEDYDPHSPSLSSSVSDDGDDAEPEFEIQDDEPSGPSTRAGSVADTEYTGTAKERPFPPQRSRPSAIRRAMGDREQKHVSFVSPSPVPEILTSSGKGNDKKRKRS